MEEYTWVNWKGRGADDKKARGVPRDVDDHQPENLHRLLLAEPMFIPYSLRKPTSIPTGYGIGQPEIGEPSAFDPYD